MFSEWLRNKFGKGLLSSYLFLLNLLFQLSGLNTSRFKEMKIREVLKFLKEKAGNSIFLPINNNQKKV